MRSFLEPSLRDNMCPPCLSYSAWNVDAIIVNHEVDVTHGRATIWVECYFCLPGLLPEKRKTLLLFKPQILWACRHSQPNLNLTIVGP